MSRAAPPSSGLHSVDQANDLASRLRFLDVERAKPEMRRANARVLERLMLGPGDRVLDVGCGAGDAARELAARVVPGGRVVGIDIDPLMVGEAERRSDGSLPVEFRVGDVYEMDFPKGSFDACRAERVFLHLAQPGRALAALVRVLAPGGRVVVLDRDIDTRTIDAADRSVTRRVVHFWTDAILGGWTGRSLWRLFREAGLDDVAVESFTVVETGYAAFNAQYDLARIVARAREAAVVSEEEGRRWLEDLEERGERGTFFASMTSFVVSGRR